MLIEKQNYSIFSQSENKKILSSKTIRLEINLYTIKRSCNLNYYFCLMWIMFNFQCILTHEKLYYIEKLHYFVLTYQMQMF
jgi:hypothetical protein